MKNSKILIILMTIIAGLIVVGCTSFGNQSNTDVVKQEDVNSTEKDLLNESDLNSILKEVTSPSQSLNFEDLAMIYFYKEMGAIKYSDYGYQIFAMPLHTITYLQTTSPLNYFSEYFSEKLKGVHFEYLADEKDLPMLKMGNMVPSSIEDLKSNYPLLEGVAREDFIALYKYIYPFLKTDEDVLSAFYYDEKKNYYRTEINDEILSLMNDNIVFISPGMGGYCLPTPVIDQTSIHKSDKAITFNVHISTCKFNDKENKFKSDDKGRPLYETAKIFKYILIPNKEIRSSRINLPYRLAKIIEIDMDKEDKKIFTLDDLILNPENFK